MTEPTYTRAEIVDAIRAGFNEYYGNKPGSLDALILVENMIPLCIRYLPQTLQATETLTQPTLEERLRKMEFELANHPNLGHDFVTEAYNNGFLAGKREKSDD